MGLNIIPFRVTDEMKEAYLFAAISQEYEKQDRESGAVNIPYFMRARQKVDQIKLNGELDKEYKKYKKKEERNKRNYKND